MTTRFVLLSLAIAVDNDAVASFQIPYINRARPSQLMNRWTSLSMVASGTGMGMGTQKKNGSKGMGKKSSSSKNDKKNGASPPFDVAKSLTKSEKLYEELLTESAKAYHAADEFDEDNLDVTSEYVVAARAKPGSSSLAAASDWIPVAQICIVRPVHDEEKDGVLDPSVPAAVSYYCREINHAACLASPSTFNALPRNFVEYSVEPNDSFFKYVYEEVIRGKSSSGSFEEGGSTVLMTKSKAREILGLQAGCKDPVLIKQAYRKMAFDLHPDRFVNSERTEEEIDTSSKKFLSVKIAYEALTSGVRGSVDANGDAKSWYESLGGKSRTEFFGPIELMSMEKAGALCNKAFKSAVACVDPDLTMAFVARNQAAKR
ncbi:hypothetical protein HJC23_008760 [Cyclotella cryptica]|uniref:J domain-containing protein n=1 Tax=Cyclotella cryptica TaxID=29204 RepID=A0ABD3PDH8_9STRA|eukprot:CCRYP_015678-RA/>CCRYP_015678-RA protein AED:0.19 eAED:0.19 QI:0/-1/0/1/-1/1/1/0/373